MVVTIKTMNVDTMNKVKSANNSLGKSISITERELEVLIKISEGLKVKEIAQDLYLSCHTVISHKRSLLDKFKAKNCVDLAVKAIRNKIINLE